MQNGAALNSKEKSVRRLAKLLPSQVVDVPGDHVGLELVDDFSVEFPKLLETRRRNQVVIRVGIDTPSEAGDISQDRAGGNGDAVLGVLARPVVVERFRTIEVGRDVGVVLVGNADCVNLVGIDVPIAGPPCPHRHVGDGFGVGIEGTDATPASVVVWQGSSEDIVPPDLAERFAEETLDDERARFLDMPFEEVGPRSVDEVPLEVDIVFTVDVGTVRLGSHVVFMGQIVRDEERLDIFGGNVFEFSLQIGVTVVTVDL